MSRTMNSARSSSVLVPKDASRRCLGLRLKVQGPEFGFQGLGFRRTIRGLEFGIQGLGFRLSFRV